MYIINVIVNIMYIYIILDFSKNYNKICANKIYLNIAKHVH